MVLSCFSNKKIFPNSKADLFGNRLTISNGTVPYSPMEMQSVSVPGMLQMQMKPVEKWKCKACPCYGCHGCNWNLSHGNAAYITLHKKCITPEIEKVSSYMWDSTIYIVIVYLLNLYFNYCLSYIGSCRCLASYCFVVVYP